MKYFPGKLRGDGSDRRKKIKGQKGKDRSNQFIEESPRCINKHLWLKSHSWPLGRPRSGHKWRDIMGDALDSWVDLARECSPVRLGTALTKIITKEKPAPSAYHPGPSKIIQDHPLPIILILQACQSQHPSRLPPPFGEMPDYLAMLREAQGETSCRWTDSTTGNPAFLILIPFQSLSNVDPKTIILLWRGGGKALLKDLPHYGGSGWSMIFVAVAMRAGNYVF